MGFITPDTFIKNTKGKKYDMDGYPKKDPYQCVDGIKKFCKDIYGKCDFNCGNNKASGLWTNYGTNGVEKYFDRYPYKEAVKGDWVIWGVSDKTPGTHVGMLVSGDAKNVKSYGQSQNGKKAFNTYTIPTKGILGVLRCKEYISHIMYKKGDNNKIVGKIDDLLAKQVKGTLYGDYTEECVKVYQKKKKLPQTGKVDFITYETMQKEGL